MRSGVEVVNEVTAELGAVLARLGALASQADTTSGATRVDDADRVDQIALLEQIKSAAAAAQHTQIVAFARAQVEARIAAGTLDPSAVERGVAEQIALACRTSPWHGSRRLSVARALHAELPGLRALLTAGRITEDTAGLVVSATRHLGADQKRRVDTQLCTEGIDELSPRRAAALARQLAYQADPAAYVARGRTARTDRRVSLRPAPDTMSLLTGFLPVEQGVACLAALRTHTDTLIAGGDTRGRGQIMADTLVERLTGQARAADVSVEVGLVMSLESLLTPLEAGVGAGVAEVVGYGPIPAPIARDLLRDTDGKRWWRRLFTRPPGGPLVGGDPRRRRFDGFLATLIGIRDQGRCRDPFCDAPIRHIDHIHPQRAGGPTSLANGRGVCARGNYVREMPDWHIDLIHDGLGRHPHTVRTTTPTGHTYTSTAGPAP